MTIIEMLQQSVILTFLGMGVVFLFLWIMTICMDLAGKIIGSIDRNNNAAQSETHKEDGKIPPQITAAITAAIEQYQKDTGDV